MRSPLTKKIAIINYKGGTAKTTTSAHLAHALSLKGYKTLLIDTDSQGSLSAQFSIKSKRTLYHIIAKKNAVRDCIVNARHNLDIICSDESTFPAELKLNKMKERELVLSKAFSDLGDYDFVIVDCAPTMNLINQNVLLFADELVLPISLEYMSLLGVKQLLKNLKIINKLFKKKLKIKKVIPTLLKDENIHAEDIQKSLQRVFPGKISSSVRYCPDISKCSGLGKTVFEYAPDSIGAEDYYKVMEEVLNHD